MARQLSLTPTHVAKIHRAIEDTGVPPGMELHNDADYAGWVDRIMTDHTGGPTWLFAYGSLIWRPEIEHVGEMTATARGWHRSFCMHMPRFRGTPDQPGLMMVLDRGGQCKGMVFRLPDGPLEPRLDKLFRREFTFKPINSMPRWIRVMTDEGPITALGFVMNRASPMYRGGLGIDEVARILAGACGHVGTGAEYLLNTVSHLEAKGIHDTYLWRLQKMVAEAIDRLDR